MLDGCGRRGGDKVERRASLGDTTGSRDRPKRCTQLNEECHVSHKRLSRYRAWVGSGSAHHLSVHHHRLYPLCRRPERWLRPRGISRLLSIYPTSTDEKVIPLNAKTGLPVAWALPPALLSLFLPPQARARLPDPPGLTPPPPPLRPPSLPHHPPQPTPLPHRALARTRLTPSRYVETPVLITPTRPAAPSTTIRTLSGDMTFSTSTRLTRPRPSTPSITRAPADTSTAMLFLVPPLSLAAAILRSSPSRLSSMLRPAPRFQTTWTSTQVSFVFPSSFSLFFCACMRVQKAVQTFDALTYPRLPALAAGRASTNTFSFSLAWPFPAGLQACFGGSLIRRSFLVNSTPCQLPPVLSVSSFPSSAFFLLSSDLDLASCPPSIFFSARVDFASVVPVPRLCFASSTLLLAASGHLQ